MEESTSLDLEAELDGLVKQSRSIVVDAVLDKPESTLADLEKLGSEVLISELLSGHVARQKLAKV